jgi:hypothetical protein
MSPVKEPHFFSYPEIESSYYPMGDSLKKKKLTKSIGEYSLLFRKARDEKIIGESSVSYLYNTSALERIKKYNSQAKFLFILRNPIERAYSHFHFNKSKGLEDSESLDSYIDQEEGRIKNNWTYFYIYLAHGLYCRQISRFLNFFEKDQLFLCLYEDLSRYPDKIIKEIFDFLAVNPQFKPDISLKYNLSQKTDMSFLIKIIHSDNPVKRALRKILPNSLQDKLYHHRSVVRAMMVNKEKQKPLMSEQARQKLLVFYREDILKLQEFLGRDLEDWLK